MSQPDYSIVVPAYNESALLGATLDALRRAMLVAGGAGELVVCDNASSDGTAEIARSHGATVVEETERQISRARNTGARVARGRFLVFVDADTLVPGATLKAAIDALASGAVCGGGASIDMPGVQGRFATAMLWLWNSVSRRRRLAAGSFLFVCRDAFDSVGGFSERVYASEEIWFSRAVKRWGRPRGLLFLILPATVQTSPRKAEWYPAPVLLAVAISFLLFPFLVRSRHFCWLWYRRPGSA